MELLISILCYGEIVFGLVGFFAAMFYSISAEKLEIYQQYDKDEEYYELEKRVNMLREIAIASICALCVCVISVILIAVLG